MRTIATGMVIFGFTIAFLCVLGALLQMCYNNGLAAAFGWPTLTWDQATYTLLLAAVLFEGVQAPRKIHEAAR